MIACNCIAPQVLWWKRWRVSPRALFVVALLVSVGMWLERFEIIVVSLSKDFLPSSWRLFTPSWVDLGLLAGTLGCFGLLFIAFLRWIPFVPVAELAALRHDEPSEVA
jgi:molybdopterin-containing oxidoreductase family membrane subunit